MQIKGYVLWEGASELDGAPIVVLATLRSKNVKTGDMVQTWILRSDLEPHVARKCDGDLSICGNCPGRGKWCYVTLHQGPLSTYRAFKRGRYQRMSAGAAGWLLRDREIRIGAYGDPAAVPARVWSALLGGHRANHTGYTHQAGNPRFASLSRYLMGSCQDPESLAAVKANGFRAFLAIPKGAPVPSGVVLCPSESRGVKCITCGLCGGNTVRGRDVVIHAHGKGAKALRVIQ